MNICWYKDDDIGIFFSDFPDISVQYVQPNFTKEDKNNVCNKPFRLNNDLKVEIHDYYNSITNSFVIKSGYTWDGATIPRFFWRILGAKTDNRFLIPSLIHDVLCENHCYINDDRYLSTLIFERLLFVSKINPLSRWIMKHSVDNFQKFCNWEN